MVCSIPAGRLSPSRQQKQQVISGGDPCCALLMVVAAGVQAGLEQVPADASSCQPSGKTSANARQLSSVYLEREGFKRGSVGGHQEAIQVFLVSSTTLALHTRPL